MNNKEISKELNDLHNSINYLDNKIIKAEIRLLIKKLNKETKGE